MRCGSPRVLREKIPNQDDIDVSIFSSVFFSFLTIAPLLFRSWSYIGSRIGAKSPLTPIMQIPRFHTFVLMAYLSRESYRFFVVPSFILRITSVFLSSSYPTFSFYTRNTGQYIFLPLPPVSSN